MRTGEYPDIYGEVAKRTNRTRSYVKFSCMGLFYGNTGIPKEPNELIDYLVDFIESVGPLADAVFGTDA